MPRRTIFDALFLLSVVSELGFTSTSEVAEILMRCVHLDRLVVATLKQTLFRCYSERLALRPLLLQEMANSTPGVSR